MFNGLVGYAGEVADGAQAAWDHAEENDARYKSGDVEGGVEADLAFLGGLAQRSHNAGCGGRLAAVLSAGWLRDLDPRAFDRGYRAAPFGDLVIDTGVMVVAPALLEEGLAASAERAAAGRLAAAEAEALAPTTRVLDAVDGRAVSGKSGFLRSTPLTRREQLLLRDELKDLGVTVERGADKVLDKIDPNYAAAFNHRTGTVYLRQGVTDYEAFHEVTHARQWAALGRDEYLAQGKYARETHVFDEIMKNESRFTKDEIKHAQDYIADLKAKFDAGLID